MSAINTFLSKNHSRIAPNPCISPDFCLDWPGSLADSRAGRVREFPKSRFATKAGEWTSLENAAGDCAWKSHGTTTSLGSAATLTDGSTVFPATWKNSSKSKNLIQEH
ncbi:hypothetical protein OY671_010776, partial [Metschnikowia pulcherrima]